MCVFPLTNDPFNLDWSHSQYHGWDPDKAVKDYYERIRDHEKHYEPLEEKTWPYIRIINVTHKQYPWYRTNSPNILTSGRGEDYGQCKLYIVCQG
jgi:hypothetical protein